MWLVDDAGKLPRGVPIILLAELLSRKSREPWRRIAIGLLLNRSTLRFTFLLPCIFFSASLSLSLSDTLCVSSRSLLLSPFDGCEAFGISFFLLKPLDALSLSPLFFLYRVQHRRFAFSVPLSCALFPYPVPSRPVVGKSGAADLLWNLYSYRAPQQWSQPPHFSTPDLCYRSGFLSSYHGNLFCEVIRPCSFLHAIMYKEIICTRCLGYRVFLLDYRFFGKVNVGFLLVSFSFNDVFFPESHIILAQC